MRLRGLLLLSLLHDAILQEFASRKGGACEDAPVLQADFSTFWLDFNLSART